MKWIVGHFFYGLKGQLSFVLLLHGSKCQPRSCWSLYPTALASLDQILMEISQLKVSARKREIKKCLSSGTKSRQFFRVVKVYHITMQLFNLSLRKLGKCTLVFMKGIAQDLPYMLLGEDC